MRQDSTITTQLSDSIVQPKGEEMYSHYAYGIHRATWGTMKSEVEKGMTSKAIAEKFDLDAVQVWFLFDKLLMGRYTDLYKRDPLTKEDVKIGQYVHCDYPEYGRGEIVTIFERDDYQPKAARLMEIKFEGRDYTTMCDYKKMTTVHDGTVRKITKL